MSKTEYIIIIHCIVYKQWNGCEFVITDGEYNI